MRPALEPAGAEFILTLAGDAGRSTMMAGPIDFGYTIWASAESALLNYRLAVMFTA